MPYVDVVLYHAPEAPPVISKPVILKNNQQWRHMPESE